MRRHGDETAIVVSLDERRPALAAQIAPRVRYIREKLPLETGIHMTKVGLNRKVMGLMAGVVSLLIGTGAAVAQSPETQRKTVGMLAKEGYRVVAAETITQALGISILTLQKDANVYRCNVLSWQGLDRSINSIKAIEGYGLRLGCDQLE
jgi:hypothetical protein